MVVSSMAETMGGEDFYHERAITQPSFPGFDNR
jgi:hypothetical protein